jgi:radical SAM superfamily enzyme YgiQ (UPF0313 family)
VTSKTDILLVTLNSTYQHSAFGLRYLYANLKELQPQSQILEFTIAQDVRVVAENILSHNPRIVGLGIYIWNARPSLDLVVLLKKLKPDLTVVIGGPEVSFETENQEIHRWADFTIKGEADFLFYDFCKSILSGERPSKKLISGPLPEISTILSPYPFYSASDIQNRVLYVEASRGCPYKCEYCLSSLDKSVRSFPLDQFLSDMDDLIQKGARQFKFVDRTFNLSPTASMAIMNFFLARMKPDLFLHFEMVPDRLPDELKDVIKKFPPGALQFEVGIQTWNPEVAKNVSRRQDYAKIKDNFTFLKNDSGVHTHADLIVGLPGETIESFGKGFDQLLQCSPDEIQVGVLKRLKGTPIMRHDQTFKMIYQEHPPFQILSTRDMDYPTIQKMVRFSKFWDLYANSGNFPNMIQYFKAHAAENDQSFFWFFMEFVEFLSKRHPEGHGIALLKLLESAWIYLSEALALDQQQARQILRQDYTGSIKRDLPNFLKEEMELNRKKKNEGIETSPSQKILKRQFKHSVTKDLAPS